MAKIRLSRSIVGDLEKQALSAVIDDGYLGMGSYVQAFEAKLKDYLGAANVVCVNSGTAALHLALASLGLRQQDEVLVQSLTYVASFQAISAAGLKPVACEIVPETLTIDLKDAERRISGRTKVIMPVHYASRPGDLDAVYAFAAKHNLRVIEDAAHAFGTVYKGRKIGASGDVICFSFDGIKNITSGEGGAVVTADTKVAQFVMDARLLGVKKDTEKRYQGQRSWEFDVIHQGYRYHMSNLFAAIGMVQLERLEKEFKPARQMLARRYHEALKGENRIQLFPDDYDRIVPHIFPIRVMDGQRDRLRQFLLDNEIESGIHYYPNHLLSFYGKKTGALPLTECIFSELLSLPLHPGLSSSEQEKVIKTIKDFLSGAKE